MPPLFVVLGPLALAAVAGAPVVVDAPITQVTVFSDRARVTRAAQVTLPGGAGGGERFELPLLGNRVDPDSIRVEITGGELRRVDIAHVDAEDFPADEARALIDEIEALDDKVARATALRAAPQALLAAVRAVSPSLPPPEPMRPVVHLNPAGWAPSMAFVDGWMERMQARMQKEDATLFELARKRQRLVDKARLLGGAQRRSGYRVVVALGGSGHVRLTMTYMVSSARWTPSYDIQLLPEGKRVQVAFAGLVSQETGEDWTDANLILSTAVPATATVLPKLLTWKIGERERFIPTPVPVADVLRPAPRAVPPLVDRPSTEELKVRLRQLAGMADTGGVAFGSVGGVVGGTTGRIRGDRDGVADEERALAKSEAMAAPPPPPAAPAPVVMAEATGHRVYDFDDDVVEGDLVRPDGEFANAGAGPMPERVVQSKPLAGQPSARRRSGSSAYEPPPDQVGLAPPPGYRPPYYGPDLPVSLAGGYDLSFPSLRPETVKSGKEARRVALFSQQWPVEVERRLFPALASEAYVTAEIKNPSATALPGGPANLSVGDDPAGTARLRVVGSGETFVLPLGLDRAIKPVRSVKLVQSEKGVFSKDDVGEYTVTIEIANPYGSPLPLKVIDQLPLTDDKNVEIKPGAMEPAPASREPLKGSLEWRITVPAGGKSIIRFGYTIRRPRSWRLHQ